MGPDIICGLLKHLKRLTARATLDDFEGAVDNATSSALLPAPQHLVDDLADEETLVDRVGFDVPDICGSSAHYDSFFVPYRDRD